MNSSDLIQYKHVDSHRVASLKGNIIAILMTTEMFSNEACLSCEFIQPDENWMRLYFLEWILALSLVSIQWTSCLADLLWQNHVPEWSGCIWNFGGERQTAWEAGPPNSSGLGSSDCVIVFSHTAIWEVSAVQFKSAGVRIHQITYNIK